MVRRGRQPSPVGLRNSERQKPPGGQPSCWGGVLSFGWDSGTSGPPCPLTAPGARISASLLFWMASWIPTPPLHPGPCVGTSLVLAKAAPMTICLASSHCPLSWEGHHAGPECRLRRPADLRSGPTSPLSQPVSQSLIPKAHAW